MSRLSPFSIPSYATRELQYQNVRRVWQDHSFIWRQNFSVSYVFTEFLCDKFRPLSPDECGSLLTSWTGVTQVMVTSCRFLWADWRVLVLGLIAESFTNAPRRSFGLGLAVETLVVMTNFGNLSEILQLSRIWFTSRILSRIWFTSRILSRIWFTSRFWAEYCLQIEFWLILHVRLYTVSC